LAVVLCSAGSTITAGNLQEEAEALRKENSDLRAENERLTSRVRKLERDLARANQTIARLRQRLTNHGKHPPGIEGKATLVGAVTFIQIWKPDSWQVRKAESGEGLDVIQTIQEGNADLPSLLSNLGG
jgi:predicted nuclease with TOPRIM domain